MRRNKELARDVDVHLNPTDPRKEVPIGCEICCDDGNVPAVWRCLACEQYMCEDDFLRHRRTKAAKEHRIIKIEDYLQTDQQIDIQDKERCQQHQDLYLTLFCLPCMQVLCTECFIENHNGHKFSNIETVVEENRVCLNNDIGQITAHLSRCRDNLMKIEADKESLLGKIGVIEKSVDSKFQEFISVLESHRENIRLKLTNVKDIKLEELERKKRESENCMAHLNDLQTCLHDMVNKSTSVKLVYQARDLHKTYLEKIEQIHLKNSPKVISDVGEIIFKPSTIDFESLLSNLNILGYVDLAIRDSESESGSIEEKLAAGDFDRESGNILDKLATRNFETKSENIEGKVKSEDIEQISSTKEIVSTAGKSVEDVYIQKVKTNYKIIRLEKCNDVGRRSYKVDATCNKF